MKSVQHSGFSILLTFSLILLSSCTPQGIESTSLPSTLVPFLTSTSILPSLTAPHQTPDGVVAAETPLPTPTPFAYTIQQGDTISSIALEFGVSIDDLVAANPEISPNAMSVGQVINIPSNPLNSSGEPTPTPASFTIQQIECYPTAGQGMWCFVLVHNDFPDFMENFSAQVTLVDANNAILASQTALLPLNILPPNTSLPLTAFFPPEIPPDAKAQVQVLTAIRLLPNDERYLPATISNTLIQVNADGRRARVNGSSGSKWTPLGVIAASPRPPFGLGAAQRRGQDLSQGLAPAMNVGLDLADRHTQALSNLLVAEVVEMKQDDGHALVCG